MSGGDDDRLPDPGTQAERTALAWQRTGLAAMIVGALLIHSNPVWYPLAPWLGALLMTAGGMFAAIVAPVRYLRVVRAVRADRTPVSMGTIAGVAVLLVIVILGTGVSLLPG
jgi:uncharacterized membrane protein YidH (DUF202 family)